MLRFAQKTIHSLNSCAHKQEMLAERELGEFTFLARGDNLVPLNNCYQLTVDIYLCVNFRLTSFALVTAIFTSSQSKTLTKFKIRFLVIESYDEIN